MPGQSVNFDFTSTGADRLASDFRKTGDTAVLAAKGARLCADALRLEERAGKAAADGLAKAERVSALLAVTEHELDAELDKTNTKLLEQLGAAELAGAGLKKAGRDAKEAGGGFSGLAGLGGIPGGGIGAAIAAGVALAPVLVTVGTGLAGLGAAAYSTIKPILEAGTATKQARDALASLDPAQKTAYYSLGLLKQQFAGFGKSLEPQVLTLFSGGLRIASHLMADFAPVAKTTGDALGGVLGQIDAEFQSGTWTQFFQFMADTAGPDVQQLGAVFVSLMNTLPGLLEALQPIATETLVLVTDFTNLTGAVVNFGKSNDQLSASVGTNTGLLGFLARAVSNVNSFMKPGGVAAGALATALGGVPPAAAKAAANTGALASKITVALPLTVQMAAGLSVEAVNAAAAGSSVTTLNTAWDTFLGMSTGLENAQLSIIANLKTLAGDAAKAGASFNGTNDASVTLQQTFESGLLPSVQNVIGSMRTAHATTRDLATVIATDLKPAVDAGALSNKAFRTQLYDLAVQAGYTGPNQLGPLQKWFDKNKSSTDAAKTAVDKYAAALGTIPSTVKTTLQLFASGQGGVKVFSQGLAAKEIMLSKLAAGGMVRMGSGPTADDVPAMLSHGEFVHKSAAVSHYGVPAMEAVNAGKAVIGFAAGGVATLGRQSSALPRAVSAAVAADTQAAYAGDLAAVLKAMKAQILNALGTTGPTIVNYARSFLGRIPYVFGGDSLTSGIDCSGFTQAIYGAYGIHAPRTSEAQYGWATRSGPVPGGLAFYVSPAGGPPPGHVAIVQNASSVISQGGGMGPTIESLHFLPLMGTGVPKGGFPSSTGGGGNGAILVGGGSGSLQQIAQTLLRQRGWIPQWPSFNALENREAGWRLDATNPSSKAYGMAQFDVPPGGNLAANKAMYYAYGGNPNTGLGQLTAMMNYMAQRYPSGPDQAWNHESLFGWYDRGGWLPRGLSLAYNGTGRPEQVIPAGRGGGGGVTVVLENRGVIGSPLELETWLVRAVDAARRKGRM